ncbi:MAG: hypothetical protein K2L51_02560, partial [Clostridiales bacterium]|nr:hypothetical protein [Clostridiales bacterium]
MLGNATAYIEAGNIRSNTAPAGYTAYAIHAANSTIKAQGGTIGGDSAQGNTRGGGVYLGADAHLIASSSFSVRNNRNTSNAACNVFVYSSSARISFESNFTGEIGITSFDGQIISTQWNNSSNIVPDGGKANYYFDNDTKLGLIKFRMHESASHAHTSKLTAAQLNASDTLSTGSYFLTEDIILTRTIYISGNVVLCLNGHKITFAAETQSVAVGGYGDQNKAATMFKVVGEGNVFSLYDCTSKLTHQSDEWGAPDQYTGTGELNGNDGFYFAVDVFSGGKFNFYSGKITHFGITVIRVDGVGSVFNMFGGTLTDCTMHYGTFRGISQSIYEYFGLTGGYVRLWNSGEFNLYDGIISNLASTPASSGAYATHFYIDGTIYVPNGCSMTMYGGKISNCMATNGSSVDVAAG